MSLPRHRRRPGVPTVVVALLVGALAVIAPGPAGAQGEPAELTVTDLSTDTHPEVDAVVVSPPVSTGRAVRPTDFVVTEDGAPVEIEVDVLDPDRLQVVLAVDTSGSMQGAALDAARDAARQFVSAMPAAVPIGVVGFDTDAVASEFTTDRAVTEFVLGGLVAGGETALYDATVSAAGLFDDQDATKVIVLVSDGGDTVSEATLDQAVQSVADAGITVYSIALVTGETDLGALEQIATGSSGRLVAADDPVALAGIYERIAGEVTTLSRLSWISPNGGATDVVIRLDHPEVGALEFRRTLDYPTPVVAPTTTAVTTEPSPTSAPVTAVDDAVAEPVAAPAPADRSPWKLRVGLAAVGLALLVVGLLAFAPRRRIRRLAPELAPVDSEGRTGLPARLVDRIAGATDRMLQRNDRGSRLQRVLDEAGIDLPVADAVTRAAGLAVVALLFGVLVGSVVVGLLLALASVGLLRFLVARRADRRSSAFADQLESTLQIMVGSLRAGFGLNQAIATVARESDDPTAREFSRAISEVRLGKDLVDALEGVADRCRSEDFAWVAQSIAINREVGGNLAEVLDNVSATIRQRRRLARQVKALSAEGRISAVVLLILPVAMALWMSVTNRSYLAELTDNPVGWVMIGVAGVLMVVGTLWMRKIVEIEY